MVKQMVKHFAENRAKKALWRVSLRTDQKQKNTDNQMIISVLR